MAKTSGRAGAVGNAFGRSSVEVQVDLPTLDATLGSTEQQLREFAFGFLNGRRFVRGSDWATALRDAPSWVNWSPRQRADYYLSLSPTAETWKLVEQEHYETQHLYWVDRPIFGVQDLDKPGIAHVARKFVENGCVVKAIDFLAACYHVQRPLLDPELVAEILEAARQEQVTPTDRESRLPQWAAIAHDTSSLLSFLDGAISDDRLARLEWFFLPLVRHYRPATAFARNLVRSPELYIELLTVIFKAKTEEAREATEEERARALAAYELLHGFRTLPGLNSKGTLDAGFLTQWVQNVRARAALVDRAEITDGKVGELLAYSPDDPDGAWPHRAVRDLIESLSNDDLERGLRIGVFNKRGVVSRGPGDGGRQERDIAKRYKEHARAVRTTWHRTARLLDEIAEGYSRDAKREDDRVEVEDQLWASRRPIRRAPRLIHPEDVAELEVEATDGDAVDGDEDD